MNTTKQNIKKDNFLKQVNTLFSEIKQWIINTDLSLSTVETTIEEEFGSYNAPKLLISNKQGREIAQIVPIAALIIAANGRVDINGLYDRESIILLDKGGPKITTTVKDKEDNEVVNVKHFYKGIDQAGWYWLEDKRSKGYRLNAELFFELLSVVSDYESN